jgi:RNA polymerase sigma factor (sigma-70 family)
MKRLVADYQSMLLHFFSQRCKNFWDAEELTQEVYCKILKRKDMSVDDYTKPYIFTIAWSVLRDKLRRDRVRQRDMHKTYDDVMESQDNANQISPEQTVGGDQLYNKFLTALDELSPKTRAVFILNRYEGLTYRQIADDYGISVSAVEKHMMRALQQLKGSLKE